MFCCGMANNTTQKMKFYNKDFFRKLPIWSHLLKKPLMESFIFMQWYTINNLHERVLGLILDNYETDFNSLLKQSNEMWNHHRNIQILMNLIFSKINLPNNLIHKHELETKRRRAAPYGLEKIKLSRTPIFGTSTRQNQANIYNEDYVFFFALLFYFCF